MAIQEFFTSRNNGATSNEYVGHLGRLWYDPLTNSIRVNNGFPHGLAVGGAGGSSTAVVVYQTTAPATSENGLLWFNPDTGVLSVYSSGTWVEIGGSGAGTPAIAIYQSTTPPPGADGTLWFNPTTGILSVYSSGTWVSTVDSIQISDINGITITSPQAGDTLVYNSSTNTFENKSINLTGGTVNQILVKQSLTDYDYAWEDMIIQLPESTYTKLLDQVSITILYLGEATPESLESNAVWRIQKITFDTVGNVEEVRYADGGNFDQIWNDRLTLVYI